MIAGHNELMESYLLKNMVKGWFVGSFEPTAYNTDQCEVAVKEYKRGDYEAAHFHKVATEITLVLSGRVRMRNQEWPAGSIIVLAPGEATDFEALEDAVNIVVKTPGAKNDKYMMN